MAEKCENFPKMLKMRSKFLLDTWEYPEHVNSPSKSLSTKKYWDTNFGKSKKIRIFEKQMLKNSNFFAFTKILVSVFFCRDAFTGTINMFWVFPGI